MTEQDVQLLIQWLKENADHEISFLEKTAVKAAVSRAKTVGDLIETALKLLK